MTEAEAKATTTRKTTAADKRTIVERLLAVAEDVGVLAPERSGGVPFAFRGIDAVVASLSPHLKKHGVLVVPTEVSHVVTQREAGNKVLTKAEVEVTYRFYGANGDFIDAKAPGQADDFADRSTAQAMSVAFRVALLQTFHIAAFGNEEAASEGTKNARESAAQGKVDAARPNTSSAPPANNGADEIRAKILEEGGVKGLDGDAINAVATQVTGTDDPDVWWNDVPKLSAILQAIREK